MNQIDSCELLQWDLLKEDNDCQCLFSVCATGSMNEDGNTDMNKNTLDDLQYGEGDSFLMEPISQPFDSQEPNSQCIQQVNPENTKMSSQSTFHLPFHDVTQNSPRYNVHQGFTIDDDFNSYGKKFEQDDQFRYPDDIQDISLDQFSDGMNDDNNNNNNLDHTSFSGDGSDSDYQIGSCAGSISDCSTGSCDSFVPRYPVNNGILSSRCNCVSKDGVTDGANDTYSEGHERLVAKNDNGRKKAQYWTQKEIKLLEEGVKLYGTNNWKKVSLHVGSRNVSQCVNKWMNRRGKGWKKWNKAATKILKELINQGLSFEEIQKRMTEFTYIQIYQHFQKFTMNDDPWKDWEVELLIKLKKEGKLSDTEIGKKLNNRHKDSVKSKWNKIKKLNV